MKAQVTRKLVSRKGTLLGTITYPLEWEMIRKERGDDGRAREYVRVALYAPLRFTAFDALGSEAATIETLEIFDAWSGDYPDAVQIRGVTLERFEQQPGCSFAPGAGYLRSLVE